MFIKFTAKGLNFFASETDSKKMKKLRDSFGAVPETDKTGQVKKYTEDEVRKFIGKGKQTETVESIFGIKANTTTPNVANNKGVK